MGFRGSRVQIPPSRLKRRSERLAVFRCLWHLTILLARSNYLPCKCPRLMSGLAHAGLVVRGTDSADRRRSTNRITAAGRALLRRLDGDVADAAKQTLGPLGRPRLTALRDLLVAFAPPQTEGLT